MHDEEDGLPYEEGGDVPRFYQALTDADVLVLDEDAADKALLLSKAQNQRRMDTHSVHALMLR